MKLRWDATLNIALVVLMTLNGLLAIIAASRHQYDHAIYEMLWMMVMAFWIAVRTRP